MKKRVYVIIAGVLLLSNHAAAAVRLLRPAGAKKMQLVVADKSRLYFRVQSGESVSLSVDGPGELKFIVRVVPDSSKVSPLPYSIVVSEGNRRVKVVHAETVPSSLKWKGGSEFASESRSFKLRLDDGKHVLKVAFESSNARAAGIRYVFRKDLSAGEQVSLQALRKRESVTIIVQEKSLDYYMADAQAPVEAEVVGPTRLRVTSRLVYRQGARGKQSYVVAVQRDGASLPNAAFVTTKSSVAQCESNPEWILGRSRTFFVDVPRGTHIINFLLANTDAPGVALRFSIPKESVTNGR